MSAVLALPAYGFDLVELSDGTHVKIRPIWLGDVAALRRMHGRMSERTIYYRFMTACPQPPTKMLRYLAGVDHYAREALLAVHQAEIIGVARYHTIEDGVSEVAVVVEDAWQRRGVARELLTRLTSMAQGRGIREFAGTMVADNTPASALLVSMFPLAERSIEQGEMTFRIPLPERIPNLLPAS